MNRNTLFKITGVGAILHAVSMTAGFALLARTFGYPEIIRETPGMILTELNRGAHIVPYLYQSVAYCGLLWIFVAILLKKCFEQETNEVWLEMGYMSGVLSGLVFLIGLTRWLVLFPWIADLYVTNGADAKTLELLFEAFNIYIGFSVAEHIGFLFLSLSVTFLSIVILRTKLIHSWVGWFGILGGIWVAYGNTEVLHFPFAFLVNRIGPEVLAIWGITVGIYFLLIKAPEGKKAKAKPDDYVAAAYG